MKFQVKNTHINTHGLIEDDEAIKITKQLTFVKTIVANSMLIKRLLCSFEADQNDPCYPNLTNDDFLVGLELSNTSIGSDDSS